MSLLRAKSNSNGTVARRSKSDFALSKHIMTKKESGFLDISNAASMTNLAADLRSIGNKYDKLVLKMFNERSHLRGDLRLLKKDAKLLRNEMKYLIVKHDSATAFKKGYCAENHEKERVLKAEIVTKEMGQLELTLADLMSKYYYLLEQTKTLREINSLWHIRSVMKSDFVQLKSLTQNSSDSVNTSVRSRIVRKDSKEIKSESENLTQKLRWLNKLSNEFRKELEELRSAKEALLTGRSYLEREYSNVKNLDLVQGNGLQALDLQSMSKYIRDAEVRIIDSLHERIESLDKLSDAFKAIMFKAGFAGLENPLNAVDFFEGRRIDVPAISVKSTEISISGEKETINNLAIDFDHSDLIGDSDDEPEEVHIRYLRMESIEEADLRCLVSSQNDDGGKRANDCLLRNVNRCNEAKYNSEIQKKSFNVTKAPSSGYGSIESKDLKSFEQDEPPSVDDDEFFDTKESFQSAVTIWLRQEECDLAGKISEETLTGDVNNNEENAELEFCKKIEKQFDDNDTDRRTLLRCKRKGMHPVKAAGCPGELKTEKGTANRFEKELSLILNTNLNANSSTEHGSQEEKSTCDLTESSDPSERFFMARSYFDISQANRQEETDGNSQVASKTEDALSDSKNTSILQGEGKGMNDDDKPLSVSLQQEEKIQLEDPTTNERKSDSASISLQDTSNSNVQGKYQSPEDRPVFYDPHGKWKTTVNSNTRFSRSLSALSKSSTLDRNAKLKGSANTKSRFDSQTGNSRSISPDACKVLPRSFSAGKVQCRESPAVISSRVVIPRSQPSQKQACSTLPRKMKIATGETKQKRPVSLIPKVNPEIAGKSKETNQGASENRTKSRPTSKSKSSVRPMSQVVLKRVQADAKQSNSKSETKQVSVSSTTKTVSRSGSLRQGSTEGKDDASPRRPTSRDLNNKPNSRPDNSRPAKPSWSVKQGNTVPVYGTLPRANRSAPKQKPRSSSVSSTTEQSAAAATGGQESCNQKSKSQAKDTKKPSKTDGKNCDGNEKQTGQNVVKPKRDTKSADGNLRGKNDASPSTGEGATDNNTKKRHKILSMKKKKPKVDTEEQPRNNAKPEGEKKGKKSVTEKAANFMHNALKMMSSSDSKTNSKNAIKCNPQSESIVTDHSEQQKSLIPMPSLS